MLELTITEEERQMLTLAIAELSLTRPGWDDMLLEFAKTKLRSAEMFEEFKKLNADRLHLSPP
jgi:hypothetical protein